MTGNQIRKEFLDYFQEKRHRVLKSSPLIPLNDNTLMFTNAGMVQFKKVFLGEEKINHKSAVTAQKCLRVSGKHNDLENVGKTSRHHTFFEMLGNFSFGDYFKKKAIFFAWEFLTERLKLDAEKLWVTIYYEDEEAFDFWKKDIGLPKDRIIRMDEKDNFWSMGDVGPCGPCSEIIVDQGIDVGCGRPDCKVGCDCDRYLELWNLVFMQYDRDEKGNLKPLPHPNIDTGMGLERITAYLQGVRNNYESDLFKDLICHIASHFSLIFGEREENDISMRVIADHIRAITFLISDGVLPSNIGRGYVLRRILRRAARYGKNLGKGDPFLFKITDKIVYMMKEAYPDLEKNKDFITKVILNEEKLFSATLDRGLKILKEEMEYLKGSDENIIRGDLVFRLYDTFGFPVDLTRDIAGEDGFILDEDGFQKAMSLQRDLARKSWKGSGEKELKDVYKDIIKKGVDTEFVGYGLKEIESKILSLLRDNNVISRAYTGDEIEIITERSPFYGEGGGQIGDKGVMESKDVKIEIYNTVRPVPNLLIHRGRVTKGHVNVNDRVILKVDTLLQKDTSLNHTATHILHAILKEVLGDHVKQSGSMVSPERLRFDFTHYRPLAEKELYMIEERINFHILQNYMVETEMLPLEKALNMGAIALFGEKYQDIVRIVKIDGISMELCGGIHTARSGDIGILKIISEMGVAAGIRRIEAVTGKTAYNYLKQQEQQLNKITALIKGSLEEIPEKIGRLIKENKTLEREISELKQKLAGIQTPLLHQVKEIDGIKVLAAETNLDNPGDLRNMGDKLKDGLKSGIIILSGRKEKSAILLAMVTKDLQDKFHAGKIIDKLAKILGGKGGGKAGIAQAGGEYSEKVKTALEKVPDIIKDLN
ncbi:MAG: alanine--tRNA ligase [Thermodesulfobacteriota bacterium]|nr:alanine--tRNA ligase [Thermodesulfobacteriota bacterium]